MSFIYNNAIKYSDSPNLDGFGRLRVSDLTSLLEVSQVFDKRPRIVDEVTGGTVTSNFDMNNSQVVMSGTGANSYVIRQTFQSAIYQPGKSQLMEASFGNFQLESNVIKRVGLYTTTTGSTYTDNLDGFFIESNGITNEISFQIWKTGSMTYSAGTNVWKTNEININTIDWVKTNLMLVDYQWLGVGRVRFGLNLSGQTYYFTDASGTNNLNTVYMTSPNKPIRYELRTSGGTGSLNMICSQVSMEGSQNQLDIPIGITGPDSAVTLSTSGTKYPVLGIKMSSGYENISPIINEISVLNTSNDDYYITLEIDPKISGSYSFSATSENEIVKSYGNGSQTVTGSGIVIASYLGEAGTSATSTFSLGNSQVNPGRTINGRAQELWLCINPLGANATFYSAMNLSIRK